MLAHPERQPGQRLDGHRIRVHPTHVADHHPAAAPLECGADSAIEAWQIGTLKRSPNRQLPRRTFEAHLTLLPCRAFVLRPSPRIERA